MMCVIACVCMIAFPCVCLCVYVCVCVCLYLIEIDLPEIKGEATGTVRSVTISCLATAAPALAADNLP